MPSKKPVKPMTDAELEAWEATRDIEAELIESAQQMAQGKTSVAYSPVIAARKGSGLSQSRFAAPAWCFRAYLARMGTRPQAAHRCSQDANRHRTKEP